MTAVHPAVERIEAALREVADALATANLDRLLAAEAGLTDALGNLTVTTPLEGTDNRQLRQAIDRAYTELLRCRRLGNGLMAYTHLLLDPGGERTYSREGAAPVAQRAGSLAMRG